MIDLSIDMTKYVDITDVKKYDLFIDQNGYFYKIRPIKGISVFNHNTWAKMFLDKTNLVINTKLSHAEILVHYFGFLYYSHDQLKFKPIIKVANPIYCNMNATPQQLNSLFNVMMVNGEDPFDVPMLMGEEDVYDYEKLNSYQYKKRRII